jgi:hypothetical protein
MNTKLEKLFDYQLAKWITFLKNQISCLYTQYLIDEKVITPGKKVTGGWRKTFLGFKTSRFKCRRKKNWYTPSIDKTEQFGYFEKLWIASGAKLKGKERLTPRPTSLGLPYCPFATTWTTCVSLQASGSLTSLVSTECKGKIWAGLISVDNL